MVCENRKVISSAVQSDSSLPFLLIQAVNPEELGPFSDEIRVFKFWKNSNITCVNAHYPSFRR